MILDSTSLVPEYPTYPSGCRKPRSAGTIWSNPSTWSSLAGSWELPGPRDAHPTTRDRLGYAGEAAERLSPSECKDRVGNQFSWKHSNRRLFVQPAGMQFPSWRDSLRMATNSDQPQQPERINRRRLVLSLGGSLLILLGLFLPAGALMWTRGWLFILVMVVASTVGMLYLRRVNPDVIAARINRHEAPRRWDLLLGLMMLAAIIAVPIVAALDDGRYHWLPVPWWGCELGYALLITGMVGLTWAESVTKFFEPSVRIQTDRGHKVIDTGPYAVVRHPGYVSFFLFIIGTPFSLGSLWALIPAILLLPLLILRTIWEDRTLRDELAGYKEYTQRVRYRLIPGAW